MVTVVKTPQGHKIIDQPIEANIIDGGITAFVYFPYHGFSDGDTVYITSDIDEYNGFWYVTVIDYQNFRISEHADADFVEYYQDADIEYYQTQPHDWSSIFLPIVYKCTNNRWPTNNIDTARTISSFSDDNGFTRLSLSGNIRFGSANILGYVKITGATDLDFNSIWQIVEINDQDDITIDLPYDINASFTGASIQYYYNNYQVRIKVWAGLDALHPWAAKKPYEEMAELSLTPDENGEVMFSIADYIKSKIAIKNNLTLFSLPLNLDAFTGFYIQTAESYDESDNYSLYTATSEFSTDTFEGYAIAGKLPFKNVYSGDYADYVMTDSSPALWLTNADRLLAVEDLYFDISFIKNTIGDFQIIINKYTVDSITATETIDYEDQGIGVYRIPITPSASYDSFCVKAYTPGVPDSPGVPVTTLAPLVDWVNNTFGWTTGATPIVSVNGNDGVSNWLFGTIVTTAGFDYEFSTGVTELVGDSGGVPITEVSFALFTISGIMIDSATFNYVSTGLKEETFTLTATVEGAYLGIHIVNHTPFATKTYEFNYATYNAPAEPPDDGIDAQDLTVEICIDIMDACDVESGPVTSDNLRLLEDGDFRLLEDDDFRELE